MSVLSLTYDEVDPITSLLVSAKATRGVTDVDSAAATKAEANNECFFLFIFLFFLS